MASNVVIEDLSDVEDILCVTFSADDTYAYDASPNIPSEDMWITKNDLIDALLTVNDALAQTWIVDSGASFHVTPTKECFVFLFLPQAAMVMYTLETITLCTREQEELASCGSNRYVWLWHSL